MDYLQGKEGANIIQIDLAMLEGRVGAMHLDGLTHADIEAMLFQHVEETKEAKQPITIGVYAGDSRECTAKLTEMQKEQMYGRMHRATIEGEVGIGKTQRSLEQMERAMERRPLGHTLMLLCPPELFQNPCFFSEGHGIERTHGKKRPKRNVDCACGSGKKFKHCCINKLPEHQR